MRVLFFTRIFKLAIFYNFKLSAMNKIGIYFKESYKELTEKVTWPTWPQLQQSTMIVLAATILITFLVLAMDFTAGNILKFIYNRLF
jgi:preprotein translocase subunit SecE